MEIQEKKGRITVTFQDLRCCNKKIDNGELWILQDFKGFTARKLLIGKCNICGDDVCLQIMKSTDTNKTYYNLYTGIEAVKTIYREKKRKIAVFPDIQTSSLYGWIYGVNVEIKNKKGQVVQVRQYACDFRSGEKQLTKTLIQK